MVRFQSPHQGLTGDPGGQGLAAFYFYLILFFDPLIRITWKGFAWYRDGFNPAPFPIQSGQGNIPFF